MAVLTLTSGQTRWHLWVKLSVQARALLGEGVAVRRRRAPRVCATAPSLAGRTSGGRRDAV